MIHCYHCGGEHYYQDECLKDPTKRGEGLHGYNPKTASFNVDGALCDVLSLMEEKGLIKEVPQDIQDWWKIHQAEENKRRGKASR